MSDALDLQEAILAELRHADSALAACIVVTAIAEDVVLTDDAHSLANMCSDAPSVVAGAGAEEEKNRIEARLDLDWYSGLLLSAKRAMTEAHDVNAACRDIDGRPAMANAIKQVLLTLAGRPMGGQELISPTEKWRVKRDTLPPQSSATAY
jgi:hypothetical protein